jgi:hypothetical protein
MNSISNIEKRLHDLLKDPKPKIIAIKGKWGTGKTYFWKDFIKRKGKGIALKKYAYVSLFGVKELMQLKREIFVNSGNSQTASTLKKHTPAIKEVGAALLDKISSQIPLIKEVGINFGAIGNIIETSLINNIKDILICVDDLERRHDGITLSEILGFLANLRDERNCQIVLLFNEEAVERGSEDTQKVFREYREKVIDYEFRFSPQIEEIYKIVFEGTEFKLPSVFNEYEEEETITILELLGEIKLSNFRIIQKIKNGLLYFQQEGIEEKFPKLWPRLARQMIKLCAIYYRDENHVDFNSITQNNSLFADCDCEPKDLREDDRPASQIREKYNYRPYSEDIVLKEYLENGFVEFDEKTNLLKGLESQINDAEIKNGLAKVWQIFRSNFKHTSANFIDSQLQFIEACNGKISPNSLDDLLDFAEELLIDCPSKKDSVEKIKDYWKCAAISYAKKIRNEHPENVEILLSGFNARTKVIIRDELAKNGKEKSIPEAVALLTESANSWNPSDFEYLKGKTSEDFSKWMKESDEVNLLSKIRKLLERMTNDEGCQDIKNNLIAALKRISEESEINMKRIKVQVKCDFTDSAAKE